MPAAGAPAPLPPHVSDAPSPLLPARRSRPGPAAPGRSGQFRAGASAVPAWPGVTGSSAPNAPAGRVGGAEAWWWPLDLAVMGGQLLWFGLAGIGLGLAMAAAAWIAG